MSDASLELGVYARSRLEQESLVTFTDPSTPFPRWKSARPKDTSGGPCDGLFRPQSTHNAFPDICLEGLRASSSYQ